MSERFLKFSENKRISKVNYDFYFQRWYNYHSLLLGSMIFCGKKIMAFKFIISLKQFLKLKEGFDPYLIFLVAMLQVTPNLLLRAIRMGSGSKNVPLPISEKKKIAFAIRWTVKFLKKAHGFVKASMLADLLHLAAYGKGESIKIKENVYLDALENRHLVRYFK